MLDNLSAHKTPAVEQFLAEHPKVRFHFTPTYSSWLNQVELWFAKIERDVFARGIFTSVADLRRKLMRYIRAYAKLARPFRWTYGDVKRRIVTKRMHWDGQLELMMLRLLGYAGRYRNQDRLADFDPIEQVPWA